MNKIKILVKKEILDILRDRKTLVMMVVIPILLYPAIMISMTLILSSYEHSQSDKQYTVGYAKDSIELVHELEAVYEESKDDLELKLSFAEKSKGETDIWFSHAYDNDVLQIHINYNSTNQDSIYARNALEDLLDIYNDKLLDDKLADKGLTKDFIHPLVYTDENEASESESMGMNIGGSIGMMLIVTILLGAMYPAIDATTGEKERGTLETLLTLPVTNFQMIMSKYISVSLFACVTAVLSLMSLGGSVLFMIFGFSTDTIEVGNISGVVIISWVCILLLVMISTALLITAVCMCFCIFAKSFKEANNYITPVLLVIMFASMTGMLPSARLEYTTALIPFVNVSLLIKEVAAQNLILPLAGVTIGSNFAYSVLVVWILSKMYDSENILFADGFQSFKVFQKRSEIKKGTMPEVGDLILAFSVLILLMLYVGSAVSVRNAFAGVIIQQLMILAIPVLVSWYLKSDKKELFAFSKPSKGNVLGSILLYLGVFLINLILSLFLSEIFRESTENLGQSFEGIIKQPFIYSLLVIAVMPAIGEELLFRGLLFGGLRHKVGVKWAIAGSALVFALFHFSIVKLIPTFLIGAVFAYIVSCSESIYIGMILHFANNAVSVITMKYPEAVSKILPILAVEKLSINELIITVMITSIIGIALIITGIALNMRLGKNKK